MATLIKEVAIEAGKKKPHNSCGDDVWEERPWRTSRGDKINSFLAC
jgi:hypothetical protein